MSEIENAFRDQDVEITVVADGVHVQMPYTPGEAGKSEWRTNNGIAKGLGGEWVSHGKDSHWHIPSSNEVAKPSESFGTFRCPYCNKPVNFTIGAPK